MGERDNRAQDNSCEQSKKMITVETSKYGDGIAWKRGAMLGKGSFGSVFLATLKKSRSRHGWLPPTMAVKSSEFSASASIQKEREVLGNVKGCRDIIQCYGEETTTGSSGEMVYNLLLEYGSGGTLAEKIKQSGNKGLPESEVKCYTKSILKGLCYIHEIGYAHCDLKPDNILLVPKNAGKSNEFRAKIGDFGLAKRVANHRNKKRKLEPYWRGTPMYLSPEVVADGVQELPSDIWALGCIVLEMLTGKPPWKEHELTSKEIIKKISQELPPIPSGLSKEAEEFLKNCFVKKPMFRLTAEMLLNHSFLEGMVEEDDSVDHSQTDVIEDITAIESILVVSESDDEFSHGSFSDEDSVYESEFWSEKDDDYDDGAEDMDNETTTHTCHQQKKHKAEESSGKNGSNSEAALDQAAIHAKLQSPLPISPPSAAQKVPFSLRIPAGA